MSMPICPTGKTKYVTSIDAVAALNTLKQRWMNGTIIDPCIATRAYECPCGFWHLSKDPIVRAKSDVVIDFVPVKRVPKSSGHYKRAKRLRKLAQS